MSSAKSHQLKQLNTELNKANEELKQLETDIGEIRIRLASKRNYRDSLKNKIKDISTSTEVVVSEHALLRYLERKYRFDCEELVEEILTEDMKSQVLTLGDGKYPISKDMKVVVRNNVIVTVIGG